MKPERAIQLLYALIGNEIDEESFYMGEGDEKLSFVEPCGPLSCIEGVPPAYETHIHVAVDAENMFFRLSITKVDDPTQENLCRIYKP